MSTSLATCFRAIKWLFGSRIRTFKKSYIMWESFNFGPKNEKVNLSKHLLKI